MPDARLMLHRIAPGWITKAALLAGSYLWTSLALGADQTVDNQLLIPWITPMRPNENPNYVNRTKMLNGVVRQFGFLQLTWKFSYWTFDMVGTFQTTFYTDLTKSAPVTIGTYDQVDVFAALQCYIAPLQLPGVSGEAAFGGYSNVLLEFNGGQVIT